MRVHIEVFEEDVMSLFAFLGGSADGWWVFIPAVYLALFHEPTNRRAANLLRAIRLGKKLDE